MISLLKHEPSAQSPWQNTMLGLVSGDFDFISSPFLLVHETSISGHKVNSALPGFRLLHTRSRSECTRRPQGPLPPDPARSAVRRLDRKSTRLNSSHEWISYAVFCLK